MHDAVTAGLLFIMFLGLSLVIYTSIQIVKESKAKRKLRQLSKPIGYVERLQIEEGGDIVVQGRLYDQNTLFLGKTDTGISIGMDISATNKGLRILNDKVTITTADLIRKNDDD